MAAISKARDWSSIPIERLIDREFGRNPELRRGTSAYARLLQKFQRAGDAKKLLQGILDHAARRYRQTADRLWLSPLYR